MSTMSALAALIICANVLNTYANEPSCERQASSDGALANSADENLLDGYTFLKQGARFDMVMTSIELLRGFNADVEVGISLACVSTVTTQKDNETHEVTETVDYKNDTSGTWEVFSQNFKFTLESGGYNRMNSMLLTGAPSGDYLFLYAVKECAVIEVKDYGKRAEEATETAHPEERTEENAKDQLPDCMMWTEHKKTYAAQNFCEKYFTKCCKTKNTKYEYTPDKCDVPDKKEEL